ncbi:hypothetical protein BLA17378_04511 [Burkholderia aenigmatica]|uniref:Uncharacterized protein n=1 Tax=Burkholderia aenigmatica TaxID=2015348 RepID=A0ABY6XYU2_9BURK|nr:hypothetical protein [Burkholderia aenigmatica]VWC90128.1 hypothetical protein BLA17378_04511 [Burkholderia aenigmatica]
MSTSYREDCNRAKAAREGIIEQRPARKGGKKNTPVVVEYRTSESFLVNCHWANEAFDREWRRWGNYRTIEEAEKMIADQKRKRDLWEFRIKPN